MCVPALIDTENYAAPVMTGFSSALHFLRGRRSCPSARWKPAVSIRVHRYIYRDKLETRADELSGILCHLISETAFFIQRISIIQTRFHLGDRRWAGSLKQSKVQEKKFQNRGNPTLSRNHAIDDVSQVKGWHLDVRKFKGTNVCTKCTRNVGTCELVTFGEKKEKGRADYLRKWRLELDTRWYGWHARERERERPVKNLNKSRCYFLCAGQKDFAALVIV